MKILKDPKFYRRLLIAVALVVILIRPTMAEDNSKRESTNLNVWFVVDATGSMVAKDVDGGNKRRYEKVQDDIAEIASSVPGAKYGLIVQDFTNYNASPMSYSADGIISAGAYVVPKPSFYSLPTDISDLLSFTQNRVINYKTAHPERSNAIVVMSDGEDVSGGKVRVPSGLAGSVDAAIVLGYGSESGSLIESINLPYASKNEGIIDEDTFVTYYGDDTSITVDDRHRVISKINETNLQTIATQTNGQYYHRESGNVPSAVSDTLKNAASVLRDTKSSDVSSHGELYYIVALVLVLLLLWEGEELALELLLEKEGNHA